MGEFLLRILKPSANLLIRFGDFISDKSWIWPYKDTEVLAEEEIFDSSAKLSESSDIEDLQSESLEYNASEEYSLLEEEGIISDNRLSESGFAFLEPQPNGDEIREIVDFVTDTVDI